MLVGYLNATTTDEAFLAVCDDLDGTIAAFAYDDNRATDDPKIMIKLQAAAVEGTEELWPYLFPKGIPFALYMSFVADGEDGTNPATDDIRAWVLYRTGTTTLI